MKNLYSGSFSHTLDAKGRVSLPARFREDLGGRVVVTLGADNDNRHLWLFPEEKWGEIVAKINSLPNNAQAQRVRRHIIGHAHQCEIDRLGRIQVPATLRQYAALGKEVIIMGIGDSIEMWDGAKRTSLDVAEETAGILKDLEELGI